MNSLASRSVRTVLGVVALLLAAAGTPALAQSVPSRTPASTPWTMSAGGQPTDAQANAARASAAPGGAWAVDPAAMAAPLDPRRANTEPARGASTGESRRTLVLPPAKPVQAAAPDRMFGAQLFTGSFRSGTALGFNPNYQLAIGDRVGVRLWGAFNFEGMQAVDPRGNIFLPSIGPVRAAGVRNADLNDVVAGHVRKVFRSNVQVYAALDLTQPVNVYVTGFVRQPGLYAGIASDSVISYLDRAGGVDPARGSYLDVTIRRGGEVRRHIDLYRFLLTGDIEPVQFAEGDVVVVGPRRHTVSVTGEVFNANDFEFADAALPLRRVLDLARAKPGTTHVSIVRRQGLERRTEYVPIEQADQVTVRDGDEVAALVDRYPGTIQVRIEGAHIGEHAVVLPYGAMLGDALARIKPSPLARVDALQLYRRSTAARQREMLDTALQKLEESVLSARSSTSEEASLRTREAELISRFVERARVVELKGQVVLDASTRDSVLLEDGDVLRLPERTSVIAVHGEVLFPNAVAWREDRTIGDYVKLVGGFTQGSDTSKLVLMRANGEAVVAGPDARIEAGDEIVVLPRIETKRVEVARGITQILYQIAIAARVVLGL